MNGSENSHKRLWANRKYTRNHHDSSQDQLEYEPPKDVFKDFRNITTVMTDVTPKITQKMYNYGTKYSMDGGAKVKTSKEFHNNVGIKKKNAGR